MNRRIWWLFAGFSSIVVIFLGIGVAQAIGIHESSPPASTPPNTAMTTHSPRPNPKRQHPTPAKPHAPIQVVTVGGSVARGWKDDGWQNWDKGWYGGYLVRAFHQLSQMTNIPFVIKNHTIVGANASQMDTLYKGQYATWLTQDKPDIVVISWGLLNDARPKTPLSTFREKIREEISQALSHRAMVFLVTPPATQESYTDYRVQEETYVKNEIDVAKSFNSQNVQVFDVFHAMKNYISEHHQSIAPYVGNSWHPNKKGHVLAGQLLAQEIHGRFNENSTNPLYTAFS